MWLVTFKIYEIYQLISIKLKYIYTRSYNLWLGIIFILLITYYLKINYQYNIRTTFLCFDNE